MGVRTEHRLARPSGQQRWLYALAKRAFDITVSAAVLLISLPLMAVIAVAVRLESSGPALFAQTRVGRDGKLFTLYKFRTMHASAPAYALKPRCDSRQHGVTRVGAFLRGCKLDELPQFYNVLKGEMSVVGPRPEMPFLVEQYTPEQRFRLTVLPGVTGPWQIGPHRYEPIHANLQYDRMYIDRQSFWLDLVIVARTGLMVLGALVPRAKRRPKALVARHVGPPLVQARPVPSEPAERELVASVSFEYAQSPSPAKAVAVSSRP